MRAQTSQTQWHRLRVCLVAAEGSHSFCPLTSSAVLSLSWPGNAACKSLWYVMNAGELTGVVRKHPLHSFSFYHQHCWRYVKHALGMFTPSWQILPISNMLNVSAVTVGIKCPCIILCKLAKTENKCQVTSWEVCLQFLHHNTDNQYFTVYLQSDETNKKHH